MQLHELQTVTANSLCSSLQVESLDIRYVSGMKEDDSLFRSLSLSLAGTTWGRDLISSFKSITNGLVSCWCCARCRLVPRMCWVLSVASVCVEMAVLEEQVEMCWFGMAARAMHAASESMADATDFECFGFSLPFLSFLQLMGLQN